MIVCLGWGSLIWCQKALPIRGEWMRDGPALPVEFARESRDSRMTLVLCDSYPTVPVLWAELNVATLDEARSVLAIREGVSERNIPNSIGYWSASAAGDHPGTAAVANWCRPRAMSGVVWTALKPKIGADSRMPSEAEVVWHLRHLTGTEAEVAREYVRLAPRQIVTPYRKAIEATLGWTPQGLI